MVAINLLMAKPDFAIGLPLAKVWQKLFCHQFDRWQYPNVRNGRTEITDGLTDASKTWAEIVEYLMRRAPIFGSRMGTDGIVESTMDAAIDGCSDGRMTNG